MGGWRAPPAPLASGKGGEGDGAVRRGGCSPVPDLAAVLAFCPGPGSGIYKCHITYDTQGRVKAPVFAPYRPRRVKKLVCVEVPHLDYSCKWEDRTALEAVGAGLGGDEEALILRNGLVTDTRYSNVVFGDGCRWVAPETFLLPGTKRASCWNGEGWNAAP